MFFVSLLTRAQMEDIIEAEMERIGILTLSRREHL